MMRALYSGVSGLKTHQTKMDVIGNNIANVNTVAFKSSSTTFSELMYQTTSNASGATATKGGVNAKQIGLGVTTGSTSVNITSPGATQTTGDGWDLKITGDSFFIVNNGSVNLFTKAGAFYIDGAGNLATKAEGYNVMGWQVDPTTGDIRKDIVSKLPIMTEENQTSEPEATTQAVCAGILDANNTQVNSDDGYIMSLNFYDDLGYSYMAKFAVKTVDADTKEYTIELTDILDSNDQSIYRDAAGAVLPAAANVFQQTTLKFKPAESGTAAKDAGKFEYIGAPGQETVMLNMAQLDPKFKDITIDFTESKNYDNAGNCTLSMDKGAQDGITGTGRRVGALIGLQVQQDGRIYGSYDNGNRKLLGQIAVTKFANPAGLEKMGENCYQTTLNSGEFDGIGQEITADGGKMTSGVLEMSNVDLATEFTEMITTQRGFQANSRIITTSDTLLEELVNLKR